MALPTPSPKCMTWQPSSLYHISLNSVAFQYNNFRSELDILPPAMHFDIIKEFSELSLLKDTLFTQLSLALSDIDTLFKLLKVYNKRVELHQMFQLTINWSFHSHRQRISGIVAKNFIEMYPSSVVDKSSSDNMTIIIEQGLAIGSFLSEAGWYADSEKILSHCFDLLIYENDTKNHGILGLNCCQRLLHAQNGHCLFKDAEITFNLAFILVGKLRSSGHSPDVSVLYSEISTFYILQSKYQEAYDFGVKSVREMQNNNSNVMPSSVIDVMRQAGKACVLKREFKKADLLIKQAVVLAKKVFGESHPKFADTLIDFGFYLLNIDAIEQGIQVYQKALSIRLKIFEGINLHVALAHEDLSYASYVYNYSRGAFKNARNEADKAINLLLQILPNDHLLISSSNRVKALILEEMAIDCHNKEMEAKLLKEAFDLHMHALKLASKAFGEMNVQTAKHYGNLGRLLQSQKDFQKAEEMHLRAISIKEKLLGKDDYEVALSVGHLASLYNYDMGYSDKAEVLYFRSINIGKKLFGEAYSGLEYDYRGLLNVYTTKCDMENRTKYLNILRAWKLLREKVQENNMSSPLSELSNPVDVKITVQEFLSL